MNATDSAPQFHKGHHTLFIIYAIYPTWALELDGSFVY